ncbi:MAG TPA: hypothetical protein VHX20_08150 [Terracidiphilus sp.]|nr:hypothetical protein [Terracidiphilus sp.]
MAHQLRHPCYVFLSFLLALHLSAQVNMVMQHNNPDRTGANLQETLLKPGNVNKEHFGMLFKRLVDDQLYTQPLVLTDVPVGGGFHDLVFVTTVSNSVYAFDANDATNMKPLWHVNFGLPANVQDWDFGCLDINGNMGIIGTPAIDPVRRILYVVALTKVAGHFEQRLHALDVSTGADMPGSPVTITAPAFNPLLQNQRPALLLDQGSVYVGYASHCDKEPYHGFLMRYNDTTLQQQGVFNTSPNGQEASIWQSGQAPAVDEAGNIYFVTGNGTWNGTTDFGESFVKLSPDLKVLDWFTPTNHVHLDDTDNDFDSSGAMLIPGLHIVIGGGKEGVLYLVDTQNLGHLGDENAIQRFQITSSHIHSIVFWNSARNGRLLYLWGQRDRERVYRFNEKNRLDETPFQIRADANEGHPGAMLSISANGDKDGILWAAIHYTGDSWHESRPGILHAYDADNINHELWNSHQDYSRDDCGEYSKMAPPTIVNGKVYLASFGDKNTGTGQLCVYGLLPDGEPPSAPANVRTHLFAKKVVIEWDPTPSAVTYTIEKMQNGISHVLASGLTRPSFIESAAGTGTIEYSVIATNRNGNSVPSSLATVPIQENQGKHM